MLCCLDWNLCVFPGCGRRRGAACGGAVCGSAVAGRAVPAFHEGGGTPGQTEQGVKPGGPWMKLLTPVLYLL